MSYSESIRKQQKGGAIISNNVSLTFRTMINPAIGWFEIVEMPTYVRRHNIVQDYQPNTIDDCS